MDLTKYQDAMTNRQKLEEKSDFPDITTGLYNAAVTNITWKSDKTPPAFSIEYTISGPEFAKRKVWSWYRIDQTSLGFLEQAMINLGSPISGNVAKLPDELNTILGKECQVYIKARGEYNGNMQYNSYVQAPKMLKNHAPGGEDIPAPTFNANEEIPF